MKSNPLKCKSKIVVCSICDLQKKTSNKFSVKGTILNINILYFKMLASIRIVLLVLVAIVNDGGCVSVTNQSNANPSSTIGKPLRRIVADQFDSSKPNLTIPFLASISGFILPIGELCEASAQIAVNQIAKKKVLKNYNLIVDLFDGRCDSTWGVKTSIQLMGRSENHYTDLPPILIGPGCIDSVLVGQFIKHYHFMTVAFAVPNTAIYEARQLFTNSFISIPSLMSLYGALPHFIKANGWKRIFIMTGPLSFWPPVSFILSFS